MSGTDAKEPKLSNTLRAERTYQHVRNHARLPLHIPTSGRFYIDPVLPHPWNPGVIQRTTLNFCAARQHYHVWDRLGCFHNGEASRGVGGVCCVSFTRAVAFAAQLWPRLTSCWRYGAVVVVFVGNFGSSN